jgi:hypothetical protein
MRNVHRSARKGRGEKEIDSGQKGIQLSLTRRGWRDQHYLTRDPLSPGIFI